MKCRDHLIPDDYGQLRILKERGINKNIKTVKELCMYKGENQYKEKQPIGSISTLPQGLAGFHRHFKYHQNGAMFIPRIVMFQRTAIAIDKGHFCDPTQMLLNQTIN